MILLRKAITCAQSHCNNTTHRTQNIQINTHGQCGERQLAERHSPILSQLYLSTYRQCPQNISLGYNLISPHISLENVSPQNIWINHLSPPYHLYARPITTYTALPKAQVTCINRQVPRPVIGLSTLATWAGIAQLVQRLATDCTVQGSNSGGRRDFPRPSRPALGPTQPPAQWVPGSLPGVQRPGSCVDNKTRSTAEFKERVELCPYPTLGFHGLFKGKLYLYLTLATYPAHRNILHFTTVSISAELYKSRISSLRNINPSYTPSPS